MKNKYNKNAKVGQQIALHSYRLSIIHPITKEEMVFECENDRTPFKEMRQ